MWNEDDELDGGTDFQNSFDEYSDDLDSPMRRDNRLDSEEEFE